MRTSPSAKVSPRLLFPSSRFISTKIELPEELDLTKREDLLKAASNLWKTILTKPFSTIITETDDIAGVLSTGLAKTILTSADIAHLIGLFIRYLSYYHALGLSTPSQQFYVVAAKLNELYKEKSSDRESAEVQSTLDFSSLIIY
jgi:hypothetical protein